MPQLRYNKNIKLNLNNDSGLIKIMIKLINLKLLSIAMTRDKIYCSIIFSLLFVLGLSISIGAQAATLSLSPASGSYVAGDVFKVDIMLNPAGAPLDGVDIHYLNYPSSLSVVDASGDPVTQITPGSIFDNTVSNTVDSGNRRINFSQTCSGGDPYSGSTASLASFYFKVLSSGTASVTFNYSTGSTTDCNVASDGSDVLSSVSNGSYTLSAPTLSVSLSASPSSGTAPVNDVDLTADVSGTATGTINYKFWCNCGSTCSTVATCQSACGTENYAPPATTSDPYTATDVCDYASAGTYYGKVVAERGTLSAEARTTISVAAPPTLFVDLKVATDSANWQDSLSQEYPLNSVDMRGDVSGTATGNIVYTFYCNRTDPGTNITSGYCHQSSATSTDPYTISNCCSYSTIGTYTAKVIVQRAGLAAEQRKSIFVDYKIVDTNDDGYVNTLDYSVLINEWGTATVDTKSDFNDDGLVNSLDWSLMNKDWTG